MKELNQLIDTAKINVRAGKGGDGRVSFRHEKFAPKGGPDGGDGGNGGSVYFLANNNMETLLDFRSKAVFAGQDGEMGGKKKMSGSNGVDLVVKVPVGTLIYEQRESDRVLVADMNENGKKFLIARAGNGGRGNWRFRSSKNQAPTQYVAGAAGEEKVVWLEIKMVADIGLIGFPNAGKSTLLNTLTHANAKVASYPFTTLNPNLGSMKLKTGQEVIFADIPGLIEGASEGKGLGDEFLRHIERTRMLVHLIDPTDFSGTGLSDYIENSLKLYDILRQELKLYGAGLEKKEEIIVISKCDITEIKGSLLEIKKKFTKKRMTVLGISAATGEGIEEMLSLILKKLSKLPEKTSFEATQPVKMFNINNLPNKRLVFNGRVRDWEKDKNKITEGLK